MEELRKEEIEIFGSQERSLRIRIRMKDKEFISQDIYLCMNDKRKEGENGIKRSYNGIKRQRFYDPKKLNIEFKNFLTLERKYILMNLKNTWIFISFLVELERGGEGDLPQ